MVERFRCFSPGRDRSPTPCGADAPHLAGGKANDRAINLGAINASIPPKERDSVLPRKEVIQPHLPVRLPCYALVPITNPTSDARLLAVGPPASGVLGFPPGTRG